MAATMSTSIRSASPLRRISSGESSEVTDSLSASPVSSDRTIATPSPETIGIKHHRYTPEDTVDTIKSALNSPEVEAEWEKPGCVSTLRHLLPNVSNMILSTKPKTEGCDAAITCRVHLETEKIGVEENHEVKTLLFKDKKGLHVFVTPASHEVDAEKTLKKSSLLSAEKLGLVQYAINPINVSEALLEKHKELGAPNVFIHINPAIYDTTFVTNNIGSRKLSCSVDTKEYMGLSDRLFENLRERFPEKVTIIRDESNFISHQKEVVPSQSSAY